MQQKNKKRPLRYKRKLLLSIYQLNEDDKSPRINCQMKKRKTEKFSHSIYYIKVINHQDFTLKSRTKNIEKSFLFHLLFICKIDKCGTL